MNNEQEQKIIAFIQWLPQNIQRFEGMVSEETIREIASAKSAEEVAAALDKLSKEQGGNEIIPHMVEVFQESQKTGMFAKGGKLGQLLNKYQKGGRVSEPIKGNWNDYHTIISAPGDTLRFKQYFSGPHEMQTYPNGNVRYTQTNRSGTYSSWAPGSKPNLLQKLIYGNRTASPETIENWEQLIYNHRNDSNVKDKTKPKETKVYTSPSISIFPGLTNRGLTKKDFML